MKFKLIAAVDTKNGIARNGEIPWDLPSDRARFKELTTGSVVIMGRKTLEAIGHPLANRRNIVLTTQADYAAPEGVEIYHKLEDILALGVPEAWIIGGEDLYKATIDKAETLELTKIDGDYGCDRFFPPYDNDFVLTDTSLPRHENNVTFVYATYSRK